MQTVTNFEFLITLRNNIIIQRCFNVKDYNPKAKYSMDLYELVKNISSEIAHDLKIKTSDYLCQNMYSYYYGFDDNSDDDTIQDLNQEKVENIVEEYFIVQINKGSEVIIQRSIPAHYYHPEVRVDVRPKIHSILFDLKKVLSSKDLTTKYLSYDLEDVPTEEKILSKYVGNHLLK